MKIVVTGGAGFIGSHIVEHWSNNNAEVHVLDSLRSGYEHNISAFKNVVFHKGSITDKNFVDKVLENTTYVFHLAALISVPESLEKPDECLDINVKGLLNVLDAAKKHKVKKVVHSSSAAIYGDDPRLPKDISMKPKPQTPYGITKLDGEYYLQMYFEQYGLPTTSLRYFNVFGPRQDPKSQYAA
ncbi:MAG: NAD-dependent epimerase/dehydratase family protein, partial [Ignavibacteriae bacterium]|nr:NAD-dependent epimerase/dehydratase family protein [Ignavibacteriota bacterium]